MIIIITGPTCMGKSSSALEVAKLFNAEIINGDAFQVYKQMNIGVAKPPKEYFDIVPHHLYSFIDVTHNYSIAEYQKTIRSKIDEIISKGKNVVIVGGSGLYIRSAIYDYSFREEKEDVDMSEFLKMDDRSLHDYLRKIDPDEADKIHMNNRKRVLRAIEIYLNNGQSKTLVNAQQEHKMLYDAVFYVREMDRDLLYRNINKRVDEMMDEGLLEEVKDLAKKYNSDLRAFQAIGYKELFSYLKGDYSFIEAVEKIKQNTRNYAKRQMTYIRHQFPVVFYKNTEDLTEKIKNGQLSR